MGHATVLWMALESVPPCGTSPDPVEELLSEMEAVCWSWRPQQQASPTVITYTQARDNALGLRRTRLRHR